ncbi:plexin-A4-like isoform X3 [Mytilus californianus]|uniref:plexin-A4-like isoform X3 n=1 Tax=Mytilus californianus TaxID=6549 RepID=UPI002245948F|nr:plexin-A4-like isoform X3 [Mytilus californianus]
MMEKMLLFFVSVLHVVSAMPSYKVETRILKDENGMNGSINHFVHDNSKNMFYVGAVNRIFKLSQSLEVQQQLVTGPEPDNHLCTGSACDGKTKQLTNNYNKILLIETNMNGNDRLAVCGSIFQGFCEFRDLQNISKKLSMKMHTSLVANSKSDSTVGLIVKRNLNENILFIGASYPISLHCKDEDNRNVFFLRRKDIPALSMRKLTSDNYTFSLYKEASFIEQQPPSALKIIYDKISKYIIDFVSAFSIEEYTYFLSYQPSDLIQNCETNASPKPSQSRISLTCNRDTHFYSYIDIPLTCYGNNTNYKIVRAGKTIIPGRNLRTKLGVDSEILVALFENRQNGKTDSAVCIFTIKEIEDKMKTNLKKCQNGSEAMKGAHFDDGATCTHQGSVIGSGPTLCTTIKSYYGGRISGVIGAQVQPAIVFENTALTSVTLTTTSNFTVAFLGTSNGHLKKIVIENKTVAKEYDQDLVIDEGSPINQDTFYDFDHRNLYLTSQRLVAKVPVENCGQYASCTTCLASKDPFCGWCTLENRCTLRSNCSMADQSSDRWKILTDCTAIDNISPPMASSTEDITLYMSIIDIPRDSNYSCVFDFGDKKEATPVSSWNFGISCKTPQIFSLGVDFGPTGSKNSTLSIRSEETKKLFVSRYFTFYNCGSFTSCTSCTDNNYACDWCIYQNKCTFRTNPCKHLTIFSRNIFEYDPANHTEANYTVIKSMLFLPPGYIYPQIYGDGIRRGPTFCPKIDKGRNGDVYIHNNTSKEFIINGTSFPEIRDGNGYKCIIGTGAYSNGNIEAVATRVSESQLKCQVPLKSYGLPENGILNASLRVTWGNGAEIENDGATVKIYSCSKMAHGDCSLCKNFEQSRAYLNCQWCDNPLQCEYKDYCSAVGAVARCPGPQIDKVSPMVGHVYGGTIVTIKGRNLGAELADVQNNVTIAGVACVPVRELYQPARVIVCMLGASDAGVKKGHIAVLNIPFYQFEFQYLNPILQRVTPHKRALSGGAILTLHGDPIYLGTQMEVTVNDKECNFTSKTKTQIKCRLPPGKLGNAKISVKVDGNEIRQDMAGNISFTYVADPLISKIYPLKSFQSGGRRLTVVGTNINVIDQPKMFVWTNSVMSSLTNCQVKNETFMFCPSPKLLTRYRRLRRSTALMTAAIGFIMDNAVNVQNLTGINNQLQYFPDPLVYRFDPDKEDNDNVKLFKSEIVIINGKNLMVAAKREDVQVAIGNANCNVTNLSEDQIVCNPPSSQPKPTAGYSRSDIPAVVVQIGNEKYFVGYLEYESAKQIGIPLDYIIGGVAGVGLFIIVTIIICCCIYRRQKNKSKRDFEKMRYQLDNMESNVRNECKQAFAELQTDMTDLTAEIGDGKKPLYRYDDYTFKILFPQMLDHVVLHPPIPKNGSNERHPDVAICHFSQLLQHKQFLLKFIRTLEKQKSFGIRDKSNVASLLIILYQNNLEYITEIIKSLLKELVEKSVEGKHPKLMLRRTESVVEKLLANWLALCMYKNLEESTGSSLYLLYQAIKFQVVKGPVDAVTGDARYSLSEDRLLRTENRLEPVTITLNVEYEGKKYKCRCLDCDTITQAKDKMLDVIYRNIPYSTRPAGEDLDLDWVNENKTLQDEDNIKWKENGWKQLNMLKDYKLSNGADVVLTQYQKCRTLPRSPNGFYNREAVPITRTDSEVGTKYWHLVKQPDDAQTKGLSSEIYLTRLLATKGTLKQYIDDFIKTVLTASPNMLPVIKYLFDFLDDAAKQHNITDPEVAYTWKCNSLLLRFWVNIIKNPDFVFDIHKTNIVDSCLSVVAQCFMDSCSTSDQNLSKDSPSNKLLFAKDIPVFKKSVSKYFEDIQRMPAVSDQDLNAHLAEVSRMSTNYFTKDNALFELYSYVQKYSNEINESLEADSLTRAQQFPDRLGNVITNMEGPSNVGMAYV